MTLLLCLHLCVLISLGCGGQIGSTPSPPHQQERDDNDRPTEHVEPIPVPTPAHPTDPNVKIEPRDENPHKGPKAHASQEDSASCFGFSVNSAHLLFTAFLAVFSGLLYWVARLTYYAANRPKLRIRRFRVWGLDQLPPNAPQKQFEELFDEGLEATYEITNIGGSTATIIEEYNILRPGLFPTPIEPPWETENASITKIEVGKKVIRNTNKMQVESAVFRAWKDGKVAFHAMGGVRYKDTLGSIRETIFCRDLDRDTMRFISTNNSDQNYED